MTARANSQAGGPPPLPEAWRHVTRFSLPTPPPPRLLLSRGRGWRALRTPSATRRAAGQVPGGCNGPNDSNGCDGSGSAGGHLGSSGSAQPAGRRGRREPTGGCRRGRVRSAWRDSARGQIGAPQPPGCAFSGPGQFCRGAVGAVVWRGRELSAVGSGWTEVTAEAAVRICKTGANHPDGERVLLTLAGLGCGGVIRVTFSWSACEFLPQSFV